MQDTVDRDVIVQDTVKDDVRGKDQEMDLVGDLRCGPALKRMDGKGRASGFQGLDEA